MRLRDFGVNCLTLQIPKPEKQFGAVGPYPCGNPKAHNQTGQRRLYYKRALKRQALNMTDRRIEPAVEEVWVFRVMVRVLGTGVRELVLGFRGGKQTVRSSLALTIAPPSSL